MCFKENILGCISNRNKEEVNRCISMSGCQEYLLDNDCYASLVAVLTQIQDGSVSRSYQLLRCMSTRLDPIEAGHIIPPTDFCFAVPKLFTVLPGRPSHLILK